VEEQVIETMDNSRNNNSQMTRSNSTQVEEDKQEAGGVREVMETSKGNKVMGEHAIIMVVLDMCRLVVLKEEMT